ncbi:MAG TPA: pitrilysin family protein [Chthonomonadaceae bacterium]|nr:pitrilysin family protein [Chthonomonadaceae bacterium]
MRKLYFGPLVLAAAVALLPRQAAAAEPHSAGAVPQIKYTDYRLANGLRVILSVDHSAPVVAVAVVYDVGSRNEREGRTGFAHLFEHMMFQGSQNVGKGEHMLLVQDNGGTMNGTTNQDRTNYFETVPANQLDLALFLESDRMRALDISQANLDNQRAVVQEEKRQSYDNQPYGQMGETMDGLLYSSFAYRHTTIGSMADLNAATLEDVRSFFKTYYAPNNACIAVVGDFNEGEAKKKVEKYFGGIPRQPAPPPVEITEPPLNGEKRKVLTDPLARLPRYEAAYKTVPANHPDFEALSVLGTILGGGRTSRLYGPIVDKGIALNAQAGPSSSRGAGSFNISASLAPGGSVRDLEAAFEAEIAKIQQDGVTDAEIRRAKTQARARMIVGFGGGRGGGGGGLQSVLGRANSLAQNAVFWNDAGRANTQLQRIDAVTAEDVKRVANMYLHKDNRAVVVVYPEIDPNDPNAGPAVNVVKEEF